MHRRANRSSAARPPARDGRPPRPPAAAPERRPRRRARPAHLARPLHLSAGAAVRPGGGRGPPRARGVPDVRRRRDDDAAGLRRGLQGLDGGRVPRGRGARDPGDPGQGDDGSDHLRRDDRPDDDPRAIGPRVGRADRRMARQGRRAASGTRSRPRFAISCSEDMLRESAALAARTGAWWQTHVSEDPGEIAEVGRLFPEAPGTTSTSTTAPAASGAKTILAHAVHLTDRELARLVETGTRVAHCPASNLFLASGIMPLARYLEAGLARRPRVGCRGRPGPVDLRGDEGRGVRPGGAPHGRRRRAHGAGSARVAAPGDARWRSGAGARRA